MSTACWPHPPWCLPMSPRRFARERGGSERKHGHLEPRVAELSIFHAWLLWRGGGNANSSGSLTRVAELLERARDVVLDERRQLVHDLVELSSRRPLGVATEHPCSVLVVGGDRRPDGVVGLRIVDDVGEVARQRRLAGGGRRGIRLYRPAVAARSDQHELAGPRQPDLGGRVRRDYGLDLDRAVGGARPARAR